METPVTESKKKMGLGKKILIGVVALIFLPIVVAIFKAPKSEPTATSSSTPTATPVAAVVDNSESAIVAAATQYPCKYFYDSVGHRAQLQWHIEGSVGNSSKLVRQHLSQGIKFAQKVFEAIPSLKTVQVISSSEVTDINGDAEEKRIAQHDFQRQPFMEIKWDKFAGKPILLQVAKALGKNEGYLHPALVKDLELDEIYFE